MKKAMAFSIIFSVLILFTVNSYAQPFRGMRRGEGFAHRSPTRILSVLKAKQKELKITDDQLEKIKNLVFSFEEKMIQMKSKTSQQGLELRKLLEDKENLDYEQIREALSKASNSRHDMFIEGLKLRSEIQNILTPEQREAIKAGFRDRIKEGRFFQRGERFQRMPRLRDRMKK